MELGALDDVGEYCRPSLASKDILYRCVDCGDRVIFRKGSIRRPHFAHWSKRECTYYEHPNESQIHKDAKYRLSEILKNKLPFSIYQNCNNPRCGGGVEVEMIYKDGDSVVLEYRDPHGKYVADVAVINSEKSRIIFEIKNTHRTTTVRPEPWFEFNARECFEEDQIVFTCVRNNKECIRCKALKEDWINNVPSMKPYFRDRHNAWKQSSPCLICKREKYNPIWSRGYRTLCGICLETDYDILKSKFSLKGGWAGS